MSTQILPEQKIKSSQKQKTLLQLKKQYKKKTLILYIKIFSLFVDIRNIIHKKTSQSFEKIKIKNNYHFQD